MEGAAEGLSPKEQGHWCLMLWNWDGTLERFHARGTGIVEIIKRNWLRKFAVLPTRWTVERTLAWISRNRRLMREFERYAKTVAAFIRLATIKIMLPCLTRSTARSVASKAVLVQDC